MLMARLITNKKNRRGFSLVEVLLAIAIFALISTSIIYLLIDAGATNHQNRDRIVASILADEGLEAARVIRDADWANISAGTFGLIKNDNHWQLSANFDIDPTNRFTRRISISKITDDRFQITSTVTWQSLLGFESSISASTYFTHWSKVIEPELPNWEEPKIFGTVGTNNLAGNKNPNDIFVLGNYLYLVTDEANAVDPEFFIFDISDVTKPTLVGKTKIGSKIGAVYVVGNYAYLATNVDNAELTIVKVSDPKNPTVVTRLNTPGNKNGRDVFVLDHYAYLVTESNPSNSEFYIFNVTDPENPAATSTSKVELDTQGNTIYVSGNYAYVGTDSDDRELIMIDVSQKLTPKIVKTYDHPGPGNISEIYLNGNSAYFSVSYDASPSPNFAILNINTANPDDIKITLVGGFTSVKSLRSLAIDVAGNRAFVVGEQDPKEFRVLDISNPSQPVEKAALDLPGFGVSVVYNGAYVFVANIANNQELIIIGPG